MKRKIIKLGSATLVTSLPAKWARQYNLKAGDYINLEEQNKNLVISTEKNMAVAEKVLDCKKLNTRLLSETLFAAYMLGYTTLELVHEQSMKQYGTKKTIRTADYIQHLSRDLIGVEIIEQSETRTVIKELAQTSEDELDNTIRRSFFLIKDMGETLATALQKNDAELLQGVKSRHENLRRFLLYFKRVLNKQGYRDFAKTNFLFMLADNLWLIPGTYYVIATEALENKKPHSKKAQQVLDMTVEAVAHLSELFFKYKPETAMALIRLREEIQETIKQERLKSAAHDAALYARLGFIGANIMHALRAKYAMEL